MKNAIPNIGEVSVIPKDQSTKLKSVSSLGKLSSKVKIAPPSSLTMAKGGPKKVFSRKRA